MAGHHLIDEHLAELARRLPREAVDELADGLAETWQRHVARGLAPAEAARATIAEFGTTTEIVDAFVAQAPGRRTARLLLATGPLVGACWAASLLTARAWTWPVPRSVMAVFGLILFTAVAALLAAATSRHSHRRTRLWTIGGVAVIALDTAMLGAALHIAPTPVWPMAVAVPASLTRMAVTARALRA